MKNKGKQQGGSRKEAQKRILSVQKRNSGLIGAPQNCSRRHLQPPLLPLSYEYFEILYARSSD